jgi:TonB family protein
MTHMCIRSVAGAVALVLLGVLPLTAQAPKPRSLPTRIVAGNMPVYPPIAIAAGIGGVVRLSIEVQNGAVTSVSVISASSKAAEKWLTTPARACASSWRFPEGTSGTVPAEFAYESTAPGTADAVSVHFVPVQGIKVSLQAARPKEVVIRDPSPLESQHQ